MRIGKHTPTSAWDEGFRLSMDRWVHLDHESIDRLRALSWKLTLRLNWEGLDGLSITPEMQGRIVGEMSIMYVAIDERLLSDVSAVVVAPTSQSRVARFSRGGGIVSERPAHILGESLLHGPVRLAWDEVEADRARPSSVVIHEFAHKLDMADGSVDGEPPLGRDDSLKLERTMAIAMESLAQHPVPEALPEYALTNAAEFFACATEAFFVRTEHLKALLPDLYEELCALFRQSPVLASVRHPEPVEE